jgi:tripartite-type tricarboxylate transporter receptor subunit TctC
MHVRAFGLVLTAPALACGAAHAQTYPNGQVRLIVPTSPGGVTDTIARIVAQRLSESLNQTVIVDNRPGGNSTIGAQAVARSPADGLTLLVTSDATVTANPHLSKLPYSAKDFTPIIVLCRGTPMLVVNASVPAGNTKDLIALAKAQPGKLNYGSAGNGSLLHIAGELFNDAAGVDTNHVPYKGLAPAVNDLLAGQIDFMFDSATTVSHIKAGKLKALAVVGPNRLAALPDVKVLSAHGIKGVEVASGWHGLFAPAGTPPEIVAKLNAEALKVLAMPKVKERISALGAEPASSSSAELSKRLASDIERLGPIVKKTGATLD